MDYTRRELGKLLLTLPAAGLLPRELFAVQAKPDSKWAGVQVGMNVPYNYGARDMNIDQTLANTLALGISAVEMRSQPVELAMGAPSTNVRGAAEQKAAAEQLRAWRLTADPARAAAVRKKWEDAGVRMEVLKYDGIYQFTDPEMDYAFKLAKTLGVKAISCELEVEGAKRVGQVADTHGVRVGYHAHTKQTPQDFETAFGYAKQNGANLDIGHFVAGNFGSPVAFMKQHHERITHVHIKDRKKDEGANTPFGEGDTPIKDVLRLIRDNKWPIQATIEFEYAVPAGSDRMKEIAKSIEYCKAALLS